MNTLLRSLQDYPLTMLQAIAELRRVSLASNVQRHVVSQLSEALAEPANLQGAVKSCPDEARQALDFLLRAGGRSNAAAFERRFGAVRPVGPGRLLRERYHQQPANATENLWYRGLIFRAFAETPDGPVQFLYIPHDVLVHLPRPAPAPSGLELVPAPAPAQVELAGDSLLQDACTLLCVVQNHAIRLTDREDPLAWRAGSLSILNDALLAIAASPAALADKDEVSPAALALVLAGELGWLHARHFRLQLSPGPVRAWLEAERSAQRRILLETWQESGTWNDLCRTPSLDCEDTGSWFNDPRATRARLLPLLQDLPPDTWCRLDDLVKAVKHAQPDFQRPDGDYDTWYIRRRGQQGFLRGYACWDDVEGQLLRFLVAGPMHWLGAMDVGRGQPAEASIAQASLNEVSACRLTPAGGAWLAGRPGPAEESGGAIEVLPDFTILVGRDVALAERFRVARFTTWEGGGQPFCYRITRSGLHRARAQGITVERVIGYLRDQVGEALPANVAAALERWGG